MMCSLGHSGTPPGSQRISLTRKRSQVQILYRPPQVTATIRKTSEAGDTTREPFGFRPGPFQATAARRGLSEDSISYDHTAPCRDPDEHRRCAGSWHGVRLARVRTGGRRIRRKVRGFLPRRQRGTDLPSATASRLLAHLVAGG